MKKRRNVRAAQAGRQLAELSRAFWGRGWALGTSGNFSVVLDREPLRVLITSTGVDKGRLQPKQLVQVDAASRVVKGAGWPSAEVQTHLAVVRARGAGAVLHTHSVWGTVLSDRFFACGGVLLEGYEMLKGLEGVRTHDHREWLPILENSQDGAALAASVEDLLAKHLSAHGFLLRRHGLYTWGQDLAQAKRHAEVLEFLLEVLGRSQAGQPPQRALSRARRKYGGRTNA